VNEHQHKNLWLLKPTGFNRGIGIHVFNSIADLESILWSHYRIPGFENLQVPLIPPPVEEQKQEDRVLSKSFIV